MAVLRYGAVLVLVGLWQIYTSKSDFIEDDGLGELADAFGDLFSEMTECEFKCPNGVDPVSNPNHVPTSNGCGTYGIRVESDNVPGMTKCCDGHDLCYDSCGSDKKKCDKDFKSCLEKTCEKNKKSMTKKEYAGCKATSKLLSGGTAVLGCDAYKSSQKKACLCTGKTKSKKKGGMKRTEL